MKTKTIKKPVLTQNEKEFLNRWNYCINESLSHNEKTPLKKDITRAIGVHDDKINVWQKLTALPTTQNIIQAINNLYFNPLYLFSLADGPKCALPKDFIGNFANMQQVKEYEKMKRRLKEMVNGH